MDKGVTELVQLAREGDAEAFGELYEIYSKEMYVYACSVTHNETAAQDAVSEAVYAAFKEIKNLRNVDSFKGWLFRILNISCRRQFNTLNANLEYDDAVESEEEGTDSGGIENKELSMELQQALKVISQEEQQIVMLSVVYEYKSSEIADMLDIPAVTVRSKLSRALVKLRKEMEKNREGGGTDE